MSEINRPRIALRVLAYGLAAVWPFIGTYYEYTSLNASGAMSDVCDESGCVALGTEFAHQALAWLVPFSVVSVLTVWAMGRALRAFSLRQRQRDAREAKETPVNRFVLAGLFVGVLAFAILLGVVRGMVINAYGR